MREGERERERASSLTRVGRGWAGAIERGRSTGVGPSTRTCTRGQPPTAAAAGSCRRQLALSLSTPSLPAAAAAACLPLSSPPSLTSLTCPSVVGRPASSRTRAVQGRAPADRDRPPLSFHLRPLWAEHSTRRGRRSGGFQTPPSRRARRSRPSSISASRRRPSPPSSPSLPFPSTRSPPLPHAFSTDRISLLGSLPAATPSRPRPPVGRCSSRSAAHLAPGPSARSPAPDGTPPARPPPSPPTKHRNPARPARRRRLGHAKALHLLLLQLVQGRPRPVGLPASVLSPPPPPAPPSPPSADPFRPALPGRPRPHHHQARPKRPVGPRGARAPEQAGAGRAARCRRRVGRALLRRRVCRASDSSRAFLASLARPALCFPPTGPPPPPSGRARVQADPHAPLSPPQVDPDVGSSAASAEYDAAAYDDGGGEGGLGGEGVGGGEEEDGADADEGLSAGSPDAGDPWLAGGQGSHLSSAPVLALAPPPPPPPPPAPEQMRMRTKRRASDVFDDGGGFDDDGFDDGGFGDGGFGDGDGGFGPGGWVGGGGEEKRAERSRPRWAEPAPTGRQGSCGLQTPTAAAPYAFYGCASPISLSLPPAKARSLTLTPASDRPTDRAQTRRRTQSP